MEFTSKVIDRAEEFFAEAYDTAVEEVLNPTKRVLRFGAILVTMLVAPEIANAEVYSSVPSDMDTSIESTLCDQFASSDMQSAISIDQILKYNVQMINLRASFESHFKESDADREVFKLVFDELASIVVQWGIQDSYVDVSRTRMLVDFNLALAHNLFVSVAKEPTKESHEVMFTIARNGRTLVIDKMQLNELNARVTGLISELNANSESKTKA